jgi:urease accessory protein
MELNWLPFINPFNKGLNMFNSKLIFLILALVISPVVLAHPGYIDGISAALAHPLNGWDHLLAIVLVGVIAAQYKGYKGVLLPVIFVFSMITFSIIGTIQVNLNLVEYSEVLILTSLVFFGLFLFFQRDMRWAVMACATYLFGFAHGYVHGVELGSQVTVLLGIGLTTAILHALGYAFARSSFYKTNWLVRSLGFLAGVSGITALILRG